MDRMQRNYFYGDSSHTYHPTVPHTISCRLFDVYEYQPNNSVDLKAILPLRCILGNTDTVTSLSIHIKRRFRLPIRARRTRWKPFYRPEPSPIAATQPTQRKLRRAARKANDA